jgi:hypothetical protein
MARITKIQPRPNTFRVDNIIVDEYGEKIGAIGVAIYNVLARHADRETGICYPSIRLIARKLALGRTTVKKYLRILLNHCLIAISSRLSDEGDPTSNLYITGCKFSRGHTLLSLALVEVQNKGRVGCRQKNVWKAGVAITTKCA